MDASNSQNNIRNTKQKNLILEFLRNNNKKHITADELVNGLKLQNTPVARATVYRFLATLEENNQVRKYSMSEAVPACYQFVGDDSGCIAHFHLMCLECNTIIHFESEDIDDAFSQVFANNGMVIDGCKTVFYGKCVKCVKKEG